MHYDYVVILKRENARRTDLVSFLLILFSILAFGYAGIRNGFRLFSVAGILILVAGLALSLYGLKKRRVIRFRNWLFIAGLFWLGMPFLQWLIIPFFLLAFLEIQAKYPLEIGFFPDGVVINSLFKKKFPWTAFQSVVLKDGLLTLDFRNNKLFQKEVLDDDEPEATEDEFNDYCRAKLVNLP